MAYEKGGRTDKFGNRYEKRCTVEFMIRMLQGRVKSIIAEPLGEDEPGVDILVEDSNGYRTFYQCKARNSNRDTWSASALRVYDIPTHCVEHIKNGNDRYVLISPLTYTAFSDLCLAARNSPSPHIFVNNILNGAKTRSSYFASIFSLFNLPNDTPHMETVAWYLARMDFVSFPDSNEHEETQKSRLSCMFTGSADDIYDALVNFAESDNLGKPITEQMLRLHLEKRGHLPKNLADDINIPTRILELNKQFKETFHPIGGKIVCPPETNNVIQSIENGRNVLLLGKAGAGKSGCLCSVQSYLENKSIPYLALSLDRCVPDISTENYGSSLGLPASPVQCLESQILKGSPGVLILDQLDSLRWISDHSATAYYVCKSLLREVNAFRRDGKKISTILVSRTFDYENDAELKALCEQVPDENQQKLWDTITLTPWSEDIVAGFIGPESYQKLTPSTKDLLLTPSNLAIWFRLDEQSRNQPITTQYELLQLWIMQLYAHAHDKKVSETSVKDFLNRMIHVLNVQGSFQFSCASFLSQGDFVYQFLLSEGILTGNGKTFSFSHQSISDYLQVQEKLDSIYNGNFVEDTLPPYNAQVPAKRILLQMIWQNLLDSGEDFFLPLAYHFLDSSAVRYYYKCTFWEALGQLANPTEKTFMIIDKYWQDLQWQNFIQSTVFYGHLPYVKRFVEYGFSSDWNNHLAQGLLNSIASEDSHFVLSCIKDHAFESAENAQNSLRIFAFNESGYSEDVCEFCLQILQKFPRLATSYYFIDRIFVHFPRYAIKYLLFLLNNLHSENPNQRTNRIHINNDFSYLSKAVPEQVVESIVPVLIDKTKSLEDYQLWHWSVCGSYEQEERSFVQLILNALDEMVKHNEIYAQDFVKHHMHTQSMLEHEWCLHLLCNMSDSAAELAYEWLMADFPAHFHEVTSDQKHRMDLACKVIKRFSPLWPQREFSELETRIAFYQDPLQCEIAKQRFDFQKSNKAPTYTPLYWGRFQSDVLPSLDSHRTSNKTKDLIQVLARRNICLFGKQIAFYEKDGLVEGPFTVRSPISDHLDKLSIPAWIKLLSKRDLPTEGHRQIWTHGVESTPREFSQAFQRAMENHPEKFFPIVQTLPAHIDTSYRQGIFWVLEKDVIFNALSFNQICYVVEKFTADISEESDCNEAKDLCWLVRKHADFAWPDTIYQKINCIALKHPMPAPDEFPVTSVEDKEHKTVSTLRDNSLNCVRGSAYHAIASILWKQPSTVSYFRETIYHGCTDPNPAVRFAVARCLGALTPIDSQTACDKMHVMLVQDIRLFAVHDAAWFALKNYEKHTNSYNVMLEEALRSEDKELAKVASSIATQIYVLHGGAKSVIFKDSYNDSLLEGIIPALMYYLSKDIHRERAYELFFHLLYHCRDIPTHSIAQYMNEGPIRYFDDRLWMLLVEKVQNPYFADILIEYHLRLDEMTFYHNRKIVFHLCESCCKSDPNAFYAKEKLPLLVLRLLDFPNCQESEKDEYLSLFDSMFRSNILTVNALINKLNS